MYTPTQYEQKMPVEKALDTLGVRVFFEGSPGTILPVSEELLSRLNKTQFGKQKLEAGQAVVAWNETQDDGKIKRQGKILNGSANNNVVLLVKNNSDEDVRISADSMAEAAIRIVNMKNDAREDAQKVAKKNEELREAYEKALANDEKVSEPEYLEPEFASDAFDQFDDFISWVVEIQRSIKADQFSDLQAKTDSDTFFIRLSKATRDDLTASERELAKKALALRSEISLLNANHPDGTDAALPPPYTGDGSFARGIMENLPDDPKGISAAQESAMSSTKGDIDLVYRLFSMATTTRISAVERSPISHEAFSTVEQELVGYRNEEIEAKILPRMRAVTDQAMDSYEWEGRIYTKEYETEDGEKGFADVLVMRDHVASFVYAWDSDSRVEDIDPNVTALARFSKSDVPSEEEIERLEKVLEELRHNSGNEVDFDWRWSDDPEPEKAISNTLGIGNQT